jgi:hypothetical protein
MKNLQLSSGGNYSESTNPISSLNCFYTKDRISKKSLFTPSNLYKIGLQKIRINETK